MFQVAAARTKEEDVAYVDVVGGHEHAEECDVAVLLLYVAPRAEHPSASRTPCVVSPAHGVTVSSDERVVWKAGGRVVWDLEDALARDEAEGVLAGARVADEHALTERLRVLRRIERAADLLRL